MDYHFPELKMGKFINVLLEVNRRTLEREDKHTDVALLQTEPGTPSYILSMANLFDTTQTTLSNTLRLT